MEKLREKVKNLEENLIKWKNENPLCEKAKELKEKNIQGLKKDIETLNILINDLDIKQN